MARISVNRFTQMPGSPGPSNAQGIAAGLDAYKQLQKEEAQMEQDQQEAARAESSFQQTMKLRGMQVQEQEMRMGQSQRRQAADELFYKDIVTGTNRDKDQEIRSIATPTEVALMDRMIAARDDPREYARLQEQVLLNKQGRVAQQGLNDYRKAGKLAADDGIFDIDEFYGSDESRDPQSENFNLDRANDAMREVLESHSDLEALRSDRKRSQTFTDTLRANDGAIIQSGDPKADAASSGRAREIEHELRSSINLTDRKRDELHGELSSLYNQDAAAFRAAQGQQFQMQLDETTAAHEAANLKRDHTDALRVIESANPTYSGLESFTSKAQPEEAYAFDGAVLQSFLNVSDRFPGLSEQDIQAASAGDQRARDAVAPMFDIFRAQILGQTGVLLDPSEVLGAWQRAQFGTPPAGQVTPEDKAAVEGGRGTPEARDAAVRIREAEKQLPKDQARNRMDPTDRPIAHERGRAAQEMERRSREPNRTYTTSTLHALAKDYELMRDRVSSALGDVPAGANSAAIRKIKGILKKSEKWGDKVWDSKAPSKASVELRKLLSEVAQADIDTDGPISAWVERILGGE